MFELENRSALSFTAALSFAAGTLSLLALLSGCHIGPPYHAPTPAAVTAPNYKESTVNFQDTGGWKVASPQDAMLRGNWWEVFDHPELNTLEEQLHINNQNLKEYFQNYMAARATDRRSALTILAHDHHESVLEPVKKLCATSAFPPLPQRGTTTSLGISPSMFPGRLISGVRSATKSVRRNPPPR